MGESVVVEPGGYHDSVTLMQVSQELAARDGVLAAIVAMATELNVGQLAGQRFAVPDGLGPTDLIVAVRTDEATDPATVAALVDGLLRARRQATPPGDPEPTRSVRRAVLDGAASVTLLSIPGPHVLLPALDALHAGSHVVVFSDNVSIEHERTLKDEAARRGLLVMGPDCGTVILSGVGLGFTNVVRPGPIGLVAAAGTGAQQVCALLDDAGVGVRHVLGVGGHDVGAEIGGRSSRVALELLDADPDVEVIGLVVKSGDQAVLDALVAHADGLATPCELIRADRPDDDLTAGSRRLLEHLGAEPTRWATWPGAPAGRTDGVLRGLYSGGTLAREALEVLAPRIGPIATNLDGPLDPATAGSVIIDFGADELTSGRPHPMIDHRIRLERLRADLADPATGVILLDLVLGHGAHPDPAAELVADLATAEIPVGVALIATADDPQGRDHQAEALAGAGAHVFLSHADAARWAADLLGGAS